jgi:hypothetical protein
MNYQGRLLESTNLYSGPVRIRFLIYTQTVGGVQIYESTNFTTAVDGLYATPINEFPVVGSITNVMAQSGCWMELIINEQILSPREQLSSVMFAQRADSVSDGAIGTASLADGAVRSDKIASGQIADRHIQNNAVTNRHIAANSIRGTKITDGTLLPADLNITAFSNTFWAMQGNAGVIEGTHFLGTLENVPLDLHVNGNRALRLQHGLSPNIIGGNRSNVMGTLVSGSVIGGGGNAGSSTGPNRIHDNYCFVGGGFGNTAGRPGSVADNAANVLGGGIDNVNSGYGAFLGGGRTNTIMPDTEYGVLGGGSNNYLDASLGVIAGGGDNVVTGDYSTISGGTGNRIDGSCSSVGGGRENVIDALSHNCVIAGGEENQMERNNYGVIGGGLENTLGYGNRYSVIGGGSGNELSDSSWYSVIGGGQENLITNVAYFATIPGGRYCEAADYYTFAAGYRAKATNEGAFVWADSTSADFASTDEDQFLVRASGGVGIGLTDPGYALEVSGDIASRSNVVAAGRHGWTEPRTFFETIAGLDFKDQNPNSTDVYYRGLGGYLYCASGTPTYNRYFHTGVNLPQGVALKSFRVFYYDNHSSSNIAIDARFYARHKTNSSAIAIAQIDSTSAGASDAVQEWEDSTINAGYATINNSNYMYLIRAYLKPEDVGSDLRFYGAQIEYEMESIQP